MSESDWLDATAEHLGDGAYVHFDGYHVVLTANHHQPELATGTVALDPGALRALQAWLKRQGRIENE